MCLLGPAHCSAVVQSLQTPFLSFIICLLLLGCSLHKWELWGARAIFHMSKGPAVRYLQDIIYLHMDMADVWVKITPKWTICQLLGDRILHIGDVGLSSVPVPCAQYITNTYNEYVCTPKPQPIPPLLDQILAEREIKLANCSLFFALPRLCSCQLHYYAHFSRTHLGYFRV